MLETEQRNWCIGLRKIRSGFIVVFKPSSSPDIPQDPHINVEIAMSSAAPVKAIVGGYAFGHPKSFPDVESIDKAYKLLKELGCDNIDTARVYGKSEEWLGKTGAGKLFTIDTKTPGGAIPGTSTREGIMQHITDSLGLMKVNQVDVFYLHAPDDSLDLEDQLKGINEAYQAGYFKRFGLSNFLAADVQRVYDICKAKGYPLPSVYQGNYNAVARKIETEIVPTLRKLNIAFYVYSPIAGGLLAKTSQQMQSGGAEAGRFAQLRYQRYDDKSTFKVGF
ncbi:NADP-dependent oxidoreductase domain-containing protein [Favolaschia claudopus]|uniref:NADP-dependent oxidoreductase domain-containing protein n=1 Tax=Favolaschia claudopus TaxID=2862362 RepID=A0AAW0AWC8_9AGAR